ncbi:MAG: histidine phosphatase family protein [Armatimonadetes bacterium]|nr:histidine phosphatase family protein [Armatimonadota bacterium]
MALEVWWIRHAQSEWNQKLRWQGHSDPPLSEEGRGQSLRLRERLEGEPFDRVYTSDLKRAAMTRQLALPACQAIVDPRLREICFGRFEGRTHEELDADEQALCFAWFRDPFGSRIPEGESMSDLSERVGGWFQELPASGRVAVFTHGGVIRWALWRITGPPVNGSWSVDLDNASITRIAYHASRVRVLTVNDTHGLRNGPAS